MIDALATLPQLTDAQVAEAVAAALAPRQVDAAALSRAVARIDLTALGDLDTEATVDALCATAQAPGAGLPPVAAVCVWPVFARRAVEALSGSSVRVATVAGAFPHGQLALDLRCAEVARAADDGVDEIDIVVRRGLVIAGDFERVHGEIAAMKAAAGSAQLKVILESGQIPHAHTLAQAATVALDAGADFVKTSTGKAGSGATLAAGVALLHALTHHHARTGRWASLKPSGGLRTAEDALAWEALVEAAVGPAGTAPDRLRYGASSLLKALVTASQEVDHGC